MYSRLTGDYQQCVKEYGELIARYEADVVGGNGLALCLTKLRRFPEAVDPDAPRRAPASDAPAVPHEPLVLRDLRERLSSPRSRKRWRFSLSTALRRRRWLSRSLDRDESADAQSDIRAAHQLRTAGRVHGRLGTRRSCHVRRTLCRRRAHSAGGRHGRRRRQLHRARRHEVRPVVAGVSRSGQQPRRRQRRRSGADAQPRRPDSIPRRTDVR